MSTEQHATTPDPPPPGRYLTSREAQAHFGIAERTVRLWLAQGRLHGYQVMEKGHATWRIWSVEGETPPDPAATGTALVPVPDPPPSTGDALAREQFRELLARHEQACRRIGALEEVLRDRLPALEDGQRSDRESVAVLAKSLATLAEEVPELKAVQGEERRRIRRRLQGVAVALAVLAVLLAAVGGMVLTRRDGPTRRSTPRPLRSTAAPAGSPGGAASRSGEARGRSERKPSAPPAGYPNTR